MSDHRLHRMRWAVRGALGLGVAATTGANVLHARPGLISGLIAAWAPVALLITIEVITRVPVPGWRRIPLWAATTAIAAIAAWVSYWHMVAVAVRYGEDETAAHLLPVSVDGLVVVMTVILGQLSARIRAAEVRTGGTAASAREDGPRTGIPPLPPPPDDPGIDPIEQLRTLKLVPVQPGPDDGDDVPEPDPLLPGIRRLTGHLPDPPGRVRVQNAAGELGETIGWRRADRIVSALKGERERATA